MSQLYMDKYLEESSISYDFNKLGYGLAKTPSRFPPEVETQMCVAKDEETGRELVIYMAHRKGYQQSDLLDADIIYESILNKSIVLVQYKRPTPNSTIQPQGEQLNHLLNLCAKHGCANQDLTSDTMRLQDCPVYYVTETWVFSF